MSEFGTSVGCWGVCSTLRLGTKRFGLCSTSVSYFSVAHDASISESSSETFWSSTGFPPLWRYDACAVLSGEPVFLLCDGSLLDSICGVALAYAVFGVELVR